MKKLGLTALALTLFLTACGNTEETNERNEANESNETQEESGTRMLTDGLGNDREIPANPERVIASYLEDYLVALDHTPVAQWSVNDGTTVQHYLEEDLGDLPTVPHDLPYEAVLEHEPDLLIIRDAMEEDMIAQYQQIAPTYVLNASPTNWRETLQEIGEVLGKADEAEEAILAYNTLADETAEHVSAQAEGETAAAIWMIDTSLFVVHPERSSGAVLYEDAGFEIPEVVASLLDDSDWAAVSLEELAEMDVDHLFLITDDEETALTEDRLWQNIPAVMNENVHVFDSLSAWLYYGPVANTHVLNHIEESITGDN